MVDLDINLFQMNPPSSADFTKLLAYTKRLEDQNLELRSRLAEQQNLVNQIFKQKDHVEYHSPDDSREVRLQPGAVPGLRTAQT